MNIRINKVMMVIFVLGPTLSLKGSPENFSSRVSGAELFLQLDLNDIQTSNRAVDWLAGDSFWSREMKVIWDKDCYQVEKFNYISNLETIFRRQKFMEVFNIIKDKIKPIAAEICEASLLEEGNTDHRHYFVLSIDNIGKPPEHIIFETRWSTL